MFREARINVIDLICGMFLRSAISRIVVAAERCGVATR
jgi:hypothetical protein